MSDVNPGSISSGDRHLGPELKRALTTVKAELEVLELQAGGGTAQVATDPATISLTGVLSRFSKTGASNSTPTLADGVEGQRKIIVLVAQASTGDLVITPTNLWGGTTITLDAVGESAELVFVGGKWLMVGGTGALA